LLILQNLREGNDDAKPDQPRRLQIYRALPCGVDRALAERFDAALIELQQRIRTNRWHVDDALSREYVEIGARALADGDLMEAFRARCRAMLVLMEAIHHQRRKEEEFKPLWDRRRDEVGPAAT
jgi:hypothetical protein